MEQISAKYRVRLSWLREKITSLPQRRMFDHLCRGYDKTHAIATITEIEGNTFAQIPSLSSYVFKIKNLDMFKSYERLQEENNRLREEIETLREELRQKTTDEDIVGPPYLTINKASELLGLTFPTVLDWLKQGRIASLSKKWLESNKTRLLEQRYTHRSTSRFADRYTQAEAGELLNISSYTVWKWLKEGRLKSTDKEYIDNNLEELRQLKGKHIFVNNEKTTKNEETSNA